MKILKIRDISDVHIRPSAWLIIAKISSFDQNFWHFWPFLKFSVIFKILVLPKILIYRNSFGTFGTYQKWPTFGLSVSVESVPEFSKFLDVHFWESFGYLAELSKLLTERIALLKIAVISHYLLVLSQQIVKTANIETSNNEGRLWYKFCHMVKTVNFNTW